MATSDCSTTEVVDVSVGLENSLHIWPGSRGFRVEKTHSLSRGDGFNESYLSCDVHCGTHIDSPLHFLAEGTSVDAIPLGTLLGPAYVADLRGAAVVTSETLQQALDGVEVSRLLLRTRNSDLWRERHEFVPSFTALDPAAAEWVVERGVRLVGIDYLSIERFGFEPDVHRILLGAGVVIVEGLDLSNAEPGPWDLLCLPIRLVGSEAAPARAVLRREVSE